MNNVLSLTSPLSFNAISPYFVERPLLAPRSPDHLIQRFFRRKTVKDKRFTTTDRAISTHVSWNRPSQDINVGHTPVHVISPLRDYFGVPDLLVKDESANPCGTHKDRKSAYVVKHMLMHSSPTTALCIITAGNAALSLAHFATPRKIPVVAFVGTIKLHVKKQLERVCANVIGLDLESHFWSSKELQALSKTLLYMRTINVSNLASPFKQLAYEIAPYQPDVVVLPVGGGELFVGLAAGLKEIGLKTKLIGVAVRSRDTLADKLHARYTPYREILKQWTNWNSLHRLIYLDDESRLLETQSILSRFLRCEASSAVAFEALRQIKFDKHEKVLVINTGTFSRSHLTQSHVPPPNTT